MALSNKIQSQVEPKARKETTIIVDEFGSFITETFINFLNKARSSKFRLILATQSPGDVELDGTKTRKQIADSTTIKMFLRVSDPESAEYCSSVVGTHQVEKRTSRVDDRNFHSDTYTGSIREVQEFIIHPDDIKKFGVGEGVIYTQSPFSISRVKFDFTNKFNIPIFSYLDSKIAKDVDDFNLLKSKQKIKQEQIPTIQDIELIP
jgi:type IV secretory pathway TraG/TraD family ATPase VirD4